MSKIYFSWEQYYQLIDELALKILPFVKNGEINQILSLARGGCIIGDALSRKFNIPLAIMFTSSYSGTQREGLIICEDIAKQYNHLGNKILIVDDLLDSGITLNAVNQYIQEEKEIINIDPIELQTQARKCFLNKLRAELEFDKMVCEMEHMDFNDYLKQICNLLEEYK